MCVTTNRIALPWVVSGARVLSVCLLGVALSASCRKETGDKPESTSRPTIETLDPLFVIPGHEGKIDRDYGLPLESLIAFSVRYDLGTGASTMTFLEALEGHLRALGLVITRIHVFDSTNPSFGSCCLETPAQRRAQRPCLGAVVDPG